MAEPSPLLAILQAKLGNISEGAEGEDDAEEIAEVEDGYGVLEDDEALAEGDVYMEVPAEDLVQEEDEVEVVNDGFLADVDRGLDDRAKLMAALKVSLGAPGGGGGGGGGSSSAPAKEEAVALGAADAAEEGAGKDDDEDDDEDAADEDDDDDDDDDDDAEENNEEDGEEEQGEGEDQEPLAKRARTLAEMPSFGGPPPRTVDEAQALAARKEEMLRSLAEGFGAAAVVIDDEEGEEEEEDEEDPNVNAEDFTAERVACMTPDELEVYRQLCWMEFNEKCFAWSFYSEQYARVKARGPSRFQGVGDARRGLHPAPALASAPSPTPIQSSPQEEFVRQEYGFQSPSQQEIQIHSQDYGLQSLRQEDVVTANMFSERLTIPEQAIDAEALHRQMMGL